MDAPSQVNRALARLRPETAFLGRFRTPGPAMTLRSASHLTSSSKPGRFAIDRGMDLPRNEGCSVFRRGSSSDQQLRRCRASTRTLAAMTELQT